MKVYEIEGKMEGVWNSSVSGVEQVEVNSITDAILWLKTNAK